MFETLLPEGGDILSENVSKALLEAYGIPVTEAAGRRAPPTRPSAPPQRIGYPVVLKIHSPQITHKTDVGGVVLDLARRRPRSPRPSSGSAERARAAGPTRGSSA